MAQTSPKARMGMKKHGAHGFKNGAGKSPKFRENLRREAEKDERSQRKTTTVWKNSVRDVFSVDSR